MNENLMILGSTVLQIFRKMRSPKAVRRVVGNNYERKIGHPMRWDDPQTYTEKLTYSKLYRATPEKTRLSDKVLCREWIKETIGEQYLVPVLGVYDKFSDIDFDALPDEFVIKCNHDSGSTTMIRDKSKMNKAKLARKYWLLLRNNFAYRLYEMQYRDIKPKIIIEEMLHTPDGVEPNDYKFLCFNGKPYYCWVDKNRFGDHTRRVYDLEWNTMPFNQLIEMAPPIEKPKSYELMIELATKLCANFDQARIDFYEIDGKPIFSEITFTNGSGSDRINPYEWDVKLGELWKWDK